MLAAGANPDTLQKSTITTSTGLVAYDLQAPAKNLYPVYTPIRNKIPRVGGGKGTATNWRQVNAIIGSGYDGMGWVPEGQRAAQMSYNTSNKAASYVTIGEETSATFEAIAAGRTFEDVQATQTMRLLQKMMLKEEMGILFGNNSLQLGTPGTISLSASGSGATLPAATYSVIVVALTGEGYANSSLANGVATSKSITGADGQPFTLNGGSSNKSANVTQAVTLGQTLFASVPAIQGAVAYAWYVGTAGSETLQAITTINSATFSAPLAGSRQAATAVTADCSTNTLAFNGLFPSAALSGSGAYVNYLATGTAGTGTPLTASGRGSVNEIDAMMLAMWQNYQLSVSVLFCNAQELKNITTKVLTGANGGSLVNYFQDPKAGEYIISAGGVVEFYYNPFMAPGAGRRIPIMIHPNVPPGTIVAWAEHLPIQYQSNEVPNIAEMKTRQDYYQIDWPITTRQRQVGVYAEEVLAIYAPFGLGILSNITNG
ncbi:MAG TPA: hypothetical protein VEF90_16535 [Xanthobacteraceae bacterium]|nr:hypothetical protein [Xanthobacteraceae bacterium]